MSLRLFLRRNWRGLLRVLALTMVVATAQVVFVKGYWLGLSQGLLIGAMAGLVGIAFLAHTGLSWKLIGAWGEDETRRALRKARRSEVIFGSVHSIQLENCDIDHLVASPAGWLALDSKWHIEPLNDSTRRRDIHAALRSAGKSRSVLRTLGVVADVQAGIVVWGSAAQDLPVAGRTHDEVVFVRGEDLTDWLRRVAADPGPAQLTRDPAMATLAQLRSFRGRISVPAQASAGPTGRKDRPRLT